MLLEAKDLRKRFGGLHAVGGVDLAVGEREIVGLIGPNGSGKSTLLSLLMGIHRMDGGTIRIGKTDITGWPPHKIARSGISMMFQHSRPLLQQTVLENVLLALLPDRMFNFRFSPELVTRARGILAQVQLAEAADRLPGELAFADLRRLELAKTLAAQPKLMLLDEPFAGLSAKEVREFSVLIRAMREEGRSVVLVDHNVKGVQALVDRMVAMSSGTKIADDRPDHVLADEQVRRVYLGSRESSAAVATAEVRSEPILEIADLSVQYGKATALDKVALTAQRGAVTAIVGLNGAGKSTLFHAVCRLVQSSGTIRFGGQAVADRPDQIARSGIVLCPEKRELFGDMTVFENLRMGGSHLAAPDFRQRLDFVETLFPRLAERSKQNARTLSGGEQQQLAIGRALMMKPKLLLIDEPTLGLAPVVLDLISETIERLRASGELSLFIAEQNVTFALRHANSIHLLEQGQIVWSGPTHRFADEVGHKVL
ncbi:ATP-binding cassette domain-containing protein [Bradyrhizobium sp. CCBAU 51627]|uniref:ATP-binding cassette domain-containing protein n=1 Tax=Bradyrhizobium sp. CCBAU 51627 TaxID=1325088 RepID=UPI002305B941|nr:ATP-binding cassette domain-containing protein [Bradyrhizobium sp. CCBAU 51627]MDA9433855.1 ABC transporter ATP-binding protein [Bradyrhizobium sp. CCBAU 51627]